MKANSIIIVPESHWDREWYLPFQEYRARLVIMMDKLLEIFRTDPNYRNFTFDGQTIPIEDYLEVKPEKEKEIQKYVKEKRLSIGPMYVLPDEFLISGESLIRNLLIGHKYAQKFGRVMKAGYIPDPFAHIAQLPQIISGFEIPSVLFWRGFGNEFVENELNVEFKWNAPGNAASTLGIFLAFGYRSIADLNTKQLKDRTYKSALRKIGTVIKRFEKITATPIIVLNSGSDHHEAKPEIPEIIKQWNEQNPEKFIEQNDFEYYVKKILEQKPSLKTFEGELRGGRYAHLLSGVFSTRMWIKQRNTKIENLYEKYAEPISAITWALDKYKKFEYPGSYILTGLKWLIKNHPHDSICGCSIDQVHEEMKTRFDWAEQIGNEIYKNSILYLTDLINLDTQNDARIALIVYNPLPWERKDIVEFNCITMAKEGDIFSEEIKIIDANENEIEFQHYFTQEEPRYRQEYNTSHKFTFLAQMPPCGFKIYYIIPGEKASKFLKEAKNFKLSDNSIENKYFKINIDNKGKINVYSKETCVLYENICQFEDVGDWGDEYDYSGPKEGQTDKKILHFSEPIKIEKFLNGPSQKILKISSYLDIPESLTKNRTGRAQNFVKNEIIVFISLYKEINRIDFKIQFNNKSKDHRIRVLFPTMINAERIFADGHFYVVPRKVNVQKVEKWVQYPLPTNHQKDFVAISDNKSCLAVLRCIEWLSRGDFATRKSNAGPDLNTPGAQCIGKHQFELSLIITNKSNWLDSEIHIKGKEFNNPLKPIFPLMTKTPMRLQDKLVLTPLGILSYFLTSHIKRVESYLPTEMSFLEIDNKKILLSALKKAEKGDYLVLRCYNIAPNQEKANITLFNEIKIIKAEIVNLLEEGPINEIKAEILEISGDNIKISLDPHVICTIKINFHNK
ncbi:MAG: alpha-mannosidase [Promethearchaeota archaeon]